MKKIKKIKIKAIPAKVIEETTYVCDLCGKETDRDRHRTCQLCKRDICWKQLDFDDEDCTKTCKCNDCYGDYMDSLCKVCYTLKFKKYQKEGEDIRERHAIEEEKLENKIIKESLTNTLK